MTVSVHSVALTQQLEDTLEELRSQGLYKSERIIVTPQGAHIQVADGTQVTNFCANNYLGLATHPQIVAAAQRALHDHGLGMASVRFICGTQDLHKALEKSVADFVGTDDAILYSSCFDANGGLFETLLDDKDVVISDALNHASIIDGIRLSKARRLRYAHSDMNELEDRLREAHDARIRLIATDGVFSMDGDMARLDEIVRLAREHGALVMVDDSHATGFIGDTGRGTAEHFGLLGEIDIITSTFGKALGGACGGFTAARSAVVDILRQRSRPYLFSNSLPPPVVAAALAAVELLREGTHLRHKLADNTMQFRSAMNEAGFELKTGEHPIVPVMFGDARLAQSIAADLLVEGIYVIGFCYPVVPRGEARIRVQLSALHSPDDIEQAVNAFTSVGREHGVVE